MTIKEAQQTVDEWINSTGIRYFNELTNTAMLMEEVGEVARIMARKYGEQSFKKSDESVNLPDEMADVLFVLICLANQTGVDLTEALEKNLDKKASETHNDIGTMKNCANAGLSFGDQEPGVVFPSPPGFSRTRFPHKGANDPKHIPLESPGMLSTESSGYSAP